MPATLSTSAAANKDMLLDTPPLMVFFHRWLERGSGCAHGQGAKRCFVEWVLAEPSWTAGVTAQCH